MRFRLLAETDLVWCDQIAYLVFQSFNSGPPVHDERVVGRQNSNYVYALCLELIVLLKVGWQVFSMASGLQRRQLQV